MAIVAPFKGITYNPKLYKDLAPLLAPPYDVISEEEQDYFYLIHPHNIIRLILGKKKTGDSDWDNRYTRAADYFKRWLEEGILIRSKTPCIYITSMTFKNSRSGNSFKRWGIIALVKIEEPDSKVILPHEKTFSSHKEDRLRLIRACDAQFDQIFGLYEDPKGNIKEILRFTSSLTPTFKFVFKDETEHELFTIKDPNLLVTIYEQFLDKSILIADGHHRYETSRIYRNIMRTKYYPRPSNRAYEYTMMYLTDMEDPGLLILPTHRLLTTAPVTKLDHILTSTSSYFKITELNIEDPYVVNQLLMEAGRKVPSFVLRHWDTRMSYLLELLPHAWDAIGNDLDPAVKSLDVMILSRLLFQRVLGFRPEDMDRDDIFHYTAELPKAFDAVRNKGYFMAVLMNPTKINQVKEVAKKGLVMPRKSTFFYPKVLSGIVLNKVDPYEIIYVPDTEP
jgi:uncharacterized protein (DUF1015 family)